MGQIPLRTGELITEASIKDIYLVYQWLVHQENEHRQKSLETKRYKRLRGMTYESFYALFRLARYLGLVEFVRDEPTRSSPPHGHLYSLRKSGDEVYAVVTTRRVYKLTDTGQAVEEPWRNLHKAWKNQLVV